LAVILVIGFHFAPSAFPGGFFGVDIFFVVSGFVVFGLIVREYERSGYVAVATFAQRRIDRLMPAFLGALFFGSLLSIFFLPPRAQDEVAITALLGLFGFANVAADILHDGYFAAEAGSNIFLHLWSLAVEEQFYLFVALLATFGRALIWLLKVRTRITLAVGFFSVVSMIVALVGSSSLPLAFGQSFAGFYSPLSRGWEFGAGILAYLVSERIKPKFFTRSLFATSALFSIFILTFFWSNQLGHPGFGTLIPVVATVALLIFGAEGIAGSPLLVNRLMRQIGNMSYSLYLWHWMIFVALTESFGNTWIVLLSALLISSALAWLSWVYLEKRHGERA
jgi:peptidoglycan/LPS O-acetylase OafA/YrhL